MTGDAQQWLAAVGYAVLLLVMLAALVAVVLLLADRLLRRGGCGWLDRDWVTVILVTFAIITWMVFL